MNFLNAYHIQVTVLVTGNTKGKQKTSQAENTVVRSPSTFFHKFEREKENKIQEVKKWIVAARRGPEMCSTEKEISFKGDLKRRALPIHTHTKSKK